MILGFYPLGPPASKRRPEQCLTLKEGSNRSISKISTKSLVGCFAQAFAVDSRTTKCGAISQRCLLGQGEPISLTNIRAACSPISWNGTDTVVRDGFTMSAMGISLNPQIEMSLGIWIFNLRQVSIAPMAIRSLAAIQPVAL